VRVANQFNKVGRIAFAVALLGVAITAMPEARAHSQQGQAVGQQVELEGVLEFAIEDTPMGEVFRYAVTVGSQRWNVQMPPGQQKIKNLRSGSRVRVRGRAIGQNTLDLGNDGEMTALDLAAPNTFGAQRTAIILVNFSDNLGQPVTAGDAASVTFGSVNNFYLENSYGQTSLCGDVYGYYTIPMSSSVCDTYLLSSQADQAAAGAGVNLSVYTRKIYAFPSNACTFWGRGTIGGQPSMAWIRGTYSLKVVAHELGHNFGDYHAKSMPCETLGCSTIEYGDDRDMMGQYGSGHLSAYQKERLGWLNYGSSPLIQTVTGPGTYWIDSLQTSGGTKALKILKSSSGGTSTYYYVEARTQTGFDAGYGPGVILHTGNDIDGDTAVQIDLDPLTSYFDAVLDPLQSFVDASIALTITTTSVEGGGAWVNVQMPLGPPCSYSISPTSSSTLSANGASASFSMTAGAGCAWNAVPNQSWIRTTSSGSGNGTISYSVDPNTGGSRSGTISVGGRTFTVNQGAASCTYSINPTSSGTLPGSGASGSFQMTTGSNCSWSTTTNKSWIHPSGSGSGNGTITYTVDPNSGAQRTGTITAGGRTYSITQAQQTAPCSYSINPASSGTLAATGASGNFTMTTGSGCAWTASPSASWIQTSSAGSGNGTIAFTVSANAGAARNGSISVGGLTYAISQSAAACTYSINPASSGTLSASGASSSFAVTTGSWCSWNATSGDGWISTSSSGTGSGTVFFNVGANSGAMRNGSIVVGGQVFVVSQDAAACSYSINPASSGTLAAAAGGGNFTLTTGSWCNWAAASGDSWIQTSSAGSGSGVVTFTVSANAGPARNGSISVAGQTYSVSQSAAGCTYAINPTSSGTLAASGASSSFAVTAGSWCGWSATSGDAWIHPTGTGSGNGTVAFTIDDNKGAPRLGTISVGGETYTVFQASASCTYSINPSSSGALAASAGGGSFTVTTGSWCNWSATSSDAWIQTSSAGAGNGSVTFTVSANSGAARNGSINVNGQIYSVSQAAAGCNYSINPASSGTLAAGAGGGSFSITTGSWCGWSASAGQGWIQTSSAGNGDGTITFTVSANTGAARNGSIIVAGQTYAISQAAAACNYSINPASSGTLAASGANSSFAVTTGSWCSWNATTGDGWIQTSSSGTGNGTVTFVVSSNSGAARNGSIVVGGQTFAVSQAAGTCSYSISPSSSGTLAATANGGSFSVTAGANCSWNATVSASWIVTSSAGSGNGSVTYTVSANNGSARTGTITVGGQVYTVNQAAGNCKGSALSQTSLNLPGSGGGGNVTASGGGGPCRKNLMSNASWLDAALIDPDNPTSTVVVTAEANNGPARVGTITVDDQTLTVYQDAATDSDAPVDPATMPSKWNIDATTTGRYVLALGSLDLTDAISASLRFESQLRAQHSRARIEISTDGQTWSTLATIPTDDNWMDIDVDLSSYLGQAVSVRLVFDAVAPAAGGGPSDSWHVRKLTKTIQK